MSCMQTSVTVSAAMEVTGLSVNRNKLLNCSKKLEVIVTCQCESENESNFFIGRCADSRE